MITATRASRVPGHLHPALGDYLDLSDQERLLYIPDGTPILVAPDFSIDERLVEFFARSDTFTNQALSGRHTYAREIRTWVDFLWQQDVRWDEASEMHYSQFKRWRTDPSLHEVGPGESAPVVDATTFKKAHAALTALYKWAQGKSRQYVSASPIPDKVGMLRGRREPGASNVRADRTRWVTPATYATWRDVGLLGYQAERQGRGVVPGNHDARWRGGREQTRNRAYTDLMITSALRRTELASLLVIEVPTEPQEIPLAGAVAKYDRARMWTPLAAGLQNVHEYVRFQRAAAVRRAQREGRYERMASPIYVVAVEDQRDGLHLVLDSGEIRSVEDLDEDERLRLLLLTPDADGTSSGAEPMALWLSDAGLPLRMNSWNDAFDGANDRVEQEFVRLGLPRSMSIRLSPHSLRFSFALYLLAALHRRIDEQEGYRSSDGYDARRYEQAYDTVRDLLGHGSVTTTKETYLEPVKGLRRSMLFDEASVDRSLNEIIESIASGAPGGSRILNVRDLSTGEMA